MEKVKETNRQFREKSSERAEVQGQGQVQVQREVQLRIVVKQRAAEQTGLKAAPNGR